MIQLENIKSSGYFTEKTLKKGETLFREGERDNHLYIIYSGEVSVQKEISLHKGEFKTLSILGVSNIIGEASLSHDNPKEVQIIANTDTILLCIDGKNDFPKYVNAFPSDAYALLVSIIDISNNRLIKANDQLTANHEVSTAISKIKDISMSSIYKLLLVFESILGVDQIMYFERNLVMDTYYKLKYDTKSEHGMQNTILKFQNNSIDLALLSQENIKVCRYTRHAKLSLGEVNYGFLLIGKNSRDFHENEEKLLHNTAASFVGIIHQKSLIDEARNKNYIKSAA